MSLSEKDRKLVESLTGEVAMLKLQLKEAQELVHDLFNQGCQIKPPDNPGSWEGVQYDHQCMSTYEYTQKYLIEHGLLEEDQCLRK